MTFNAECAGLTSSASNSIRVAATFIERLYAVAGTLSVLTRISLERRPSLSRRIDTFNNERPLLPNFLHTTGLRSLAKRTDISNHGALNLTSTGSYYRVAVEER